MSRLSLCGQRCADIGTTARTAADEGGVLAVRRLLRCDTPEVSRDIFVQDVPEGISSVDEIPDDWEPQPLPFGPAEVINAVRELAPNVEEGDVEWMQVELPGVAIEVNVPDTSPLESFAIHVRAADPSAADSFIGRLLDRLGARAFDPESESGIFQI